MALALASALRSGLLVAAAAAAAALRIYKYSNYCLQALQTAFAYSRLELEAAAAAAAAAAGDCCSDAAVTWR